MRRFKVILTLLMVFAVIGSGFLSSCDKRDDESVYSQKMLIEKGEEWSYYEVPQEERFSGLEWADIKYDDSNWPKGKAAFGYNSETIEALEKGTKLEKTKGIANPVYFRKIINIDDKNKIRKLFVSVDYDDGFILYLNGKAAYEHNITNTKTANAPNPSEDYAQLTEAFRSIQKKIDQSLLVNGNNVIAVEVWNNTSGNNDIYFDLSLEANPPVKNYNYTKLNLTPGKNISEMNFCWHTNKDPENCLIQVAKKSDLKGDKFPVDKAVTFEGKISDAAPDFSSNKVIVTGLSESTDYIYRIGDGIEEHWSEILYFSTGSSKSFNFIFVSDAQIGAGGHSKDTATWIKTMDTASKSVPDASFILHGGDQVNSGDNDNEWDGFFKPPLFKKVPIVSVIGNHDGVDPNYSYHFNNPNLTKYGASGAGTNYYFSYGDALFVVLNTNNDNVKEHEKTISEAIDSYPDAKWRIIAMHYNIFPSSTEHEEKSSIKNMRSGMLPIINKYDIDVVLSGHDHVYTRTKIIKGSKVNDDVEYIDENTVKNPDGTLFIAANCSSASKYYKLSTLLEKYIAVRTQVNAPTFAKVSIDEERFSITTYRTDFMEVTDTFTIVKDAK